MSLAPLPPELRSLCRSLTSTKPEQLPNILPALLRDVQRCRGPLSAPQESKGGSNGSETGVLVHKLRTQITTLLNGRSSNGRFAAVALIKAVAEVGGWECLRVSEPWVRGIISVLQKRDPNITKELAVITLTRIYTLVETYPTLAREITTPTLPAFVTACLQLLKPSASGKATSAPMSLVEAIFESFSALVWIHPTTLRPFATQIRTVSRAYVAPTSSDASMIPKSLQACSRRLVARLHMTVAKGGGSEEWSKRMKGLIKETHSTADHVFRAVEENWESTTGYSIQQVSLDVAPLGGGDAADQLPAWEGIKAGSERVIGFINSIAECLSCRTKTPVNIPVSSITDLASRISSIIPPSPTKDKSESTPTRSAIGREEKDELWSCFPEIQLATMQLLLTLVQRLGRNSIPLAQDILDQSLRMFDAAFRIPDIRASMFTLLTEMLSLCGRTLSKPLVQAMALAIRTCCRDLLGMAGQLKIPKRQIPTQENAPKHKNATNADTFLASGAQEETVSVSLSADHVRAAEAFLVSLYGHLPQEHLSPPLRSLMIKTAVLTKNREAQLASVLNPSRDKNGRTVPTILPHLYQQFPNHDSTELLRFNLRPATFSIGGLNDPHEEMDMDYAGSKAVPADGYAFDQPFMPTVPEAVSAASVAEVPEVELDTAAAPVRDLETTAPSPFLPTKATIDESTTPTSGPFAPQKRKNEETNSSASKRIELRTARDENLVPDPGFAQVGELVEHSLGTQAAQKAGAGIGAHQDAGDDDDDDDDDDESVHLNMELDSDEDEDGEGDGVAEDQ